MPSAVVAQGLGSHRGRAASMAVAALAGCAVLAVVDPNQSGRYPLCPTKALLGLDCPACGTLRGLHSLTRGRVVEALDHNLLLLIAVPMMTWAWWLLVRQASGRPVRAPVLPRWGLPVVVVGVVAFAVARNLPLAGLTWLDSAA